MNKRQKLKKQKSRKKTEKVKIFRHEINKIRKYKKYIKECSNGLVFDVYNHTIYFLKSQANEFSWQNMEGHHMSREVENRILDAINALTSTNFVYRD
jgi:hypothetical protein